ncbi:DUF3772 domain-containing protein [Yoonia sp. BS5-3]|uniref:DUF3772 domain-containing protein n=1 Tax=Yoonia phaeophyticola TaxID=3137369 RepID=A0ABZ2V5T5_9RHOB
MIIRRIAAGLLALLLCVLPIWAIAQEVSDDAASNAAATSDEDTDADWERLATRAELMVIRDDVSEFALTRIRAELVEWRDEFLLRSDTNAGRIATVDAQLEALGAAPEDGEEADAITARRTALTTQRQALAAPGLLAQEAYARADGLISEFDALVLQRQAAALTERGPSPLNLTHLGDAGTAVWSTFSEIGSETAGLLDQHIGSGQFMSVLPRTILFFLIATLCLGLGRRWITSWRMQILERELRFAPFWQLLVSLAQLLIPTIGLVALSEGLTTLDVFGLRGTNVIETVPEAGFVVIFAWWLSRLIFPVGSRAGYLGYSADIRTSGRRYALALGWALAAHLLFTALFQTADITTGARAALEWPIMVIMGVLLWRFGRVVGTKPEPLETGTVSEGRMRRMVGRFCTAVSIVGPVVAALGYGAAGLALLIPAIYSLGLAGVVWLAQRIATDISTPAIGDDDAKGLRALLPVLLSLIIYVASLPVFALIWGARVDDLLELWSRFREGFSWGETQISPTDFLTFALVFAFGYLLTRFIQATLRKSILPRTRLDLGGQNAVVAGCGYIGIILAAIVAITSAGIDLSNLAIVAGALSVGIGFGLQNIVSNFVSGIILLIERPVSEGDWIEVGGQMGYVRSISVRSTRIETFDRTDVIVPNADLVSGQVTNWTRGNLVGRVIVPVGVAYGSDVDEVKKILTRIAEAHPLVVMTPPPAVLFMAFGADSLDFEIRAILRDVNYVLTTKSELNYEICKAFDEAGIEIPFAQRDIWLRNPEALQRSDT